MTDKSHELPNSFEANPNAPKSLEESTELALKKVSTLEGNALATIETNSEPITKTLNQLPLSNEATVLEETMRALKKGVDARIRKIAACGALALTLNSPAFAESEERDVSSRSQNSLLSITASIKPIISQFQYGKDKFSVDPHPIEICWEHISKGHSRKIPFQISFFVR